jgi:hypothetical protein
MPNTRKLPAKFGKRTILNLQWVPGLFRGKLRPGRTADRSPPSSAEVLEEWSYTSNPLWATTGSVAWLLYFTFLQY